MVTVADGIHSRLRNKILDKRVDACKTGMTCCRVAVSAKEAEKALGKLPLWWGDQLETGQSHFRLVEALDDTSRLLVSYPLRDIAWMNMAWIFRTQKQRQSTTESWNADGDRDEIVEMFADFDDELKTLLR